MKKRTTLLFLSGMLFLSCNKVNSLDTGSSPQSPKGELITLKSGVVVEKIGDQHLFEGDIALSDAQLEALKETGSFLPTQAPKRITPQQQAEESLKFKNVGVHPSTYTTWAAVWYTLSPGLSDWTRRSITAAIQHWEQQTNVRFYNATGLPTVDYYGHPYPYVEFMQSTTANSSAVGRVGGRQVLNLAYSQPVSVAIHEIGHAIGLFHEMSRPDRDYYVNVNRDLVPEHNRHNFDKRTTNHIALGPFDFESIMMYDPYGFTTNPNIPVITKKDGSTNFGHAAGLSFYDRIWANNYYLPYVLRTDSYIELDQVVYKTDNTVMTELERLGLQATLNNGNYIAPDCCRIPKNHY